MMIEWGIIIGLVMSSIFLAWKMYQWKIRYVLLREKFQFVQKNNEEIKETFKALSHDALEKNNQIFLDLAKDKLKRRYAEVKKFSTREFKPTNHKVPQNNRAGGQ